MATFQFLLRLSLAGLSFTFFGCNTSPNANLPKNTPTPEPLNSPEIVATAPPRSFDADLDIGVVLAGSDCSELLIRNAELQPGDEIQVVQVDDSPHIKLLAKVVGPNSCPKSPSSGIAGIEFDGDESIPSEYEIRFDENNDPDSGFGVVSSKARVEINKGVANLTADSLPSPLLFRVCSGNESYHMTVWQGKPLVGKRVWYSYWSLSYGTVPTCQKKDYE